MENKNSLIMTAVIFIVIGILAGFWGGSMLGKRAGQAAAEEQLAPLVDLAFPKPAEDIRSMTGTVKGVYGATINLEINDPNDYLPHLDGTSRAKQSRSANVTPNTKYVVVLNGQISNKPFSSSDIKTGDIITVRSDQNIRDLKTFDVFEVDLVR